jgi:hypothetical protein
MGNTDFERAKQLLKEKIVHVLPEAGDFTPPIPGLMLFRRDTVNEKENCLYGPMIAVVIQGFKRVIFGNEEYQYGEDYCIVSSVDMPGITTVTKAPKGKPFLSFLLLLDRHLIAQLLAEIGTPRTTMIPMRRYFLKKSSLM